MSAIAGFDAQAGQPGGAEGVSSNYIVRNGHQHRSAKSYRKNIGATARRLKNRLDP
jgi:hypothetical protein